MDRLRCSIKNIGILHPPIIQQTDKGFRIINGRKRIRIAREFNLDPLLCHILTRDLPIIQVLTTHLTEQQLSGSISTIEQAYFLRLCLIFIEEKEVRDVFLPLLGHPAQTKVIDKLLGLLQLESQLQLLLHQQLTNEKTASALLELDRKDRIILGDIIINLKMGKGKQQRLLTLCKDLSRRHNTSIETILANIEAERILHHPAMNPPQKTKQLLELLQKQQSPLYQKAKEDFKINVKQLNLPDHCGLDHSPAFEKDEVTLSINFKDIGQCQKTWQVIRAIIFKDNSNVRA